MNERMKCHILVKRHDLLFVVTSQCVYKYFVHNNKFKISRINLTRDYLKKMMKLFAWKIIVKNYFHKSRSQRIRSNTFKNYKRYMNKRYKHEEEILGWKSTLIYIQIIGINTLTNHYINMVLKRNNWPI